MNQLKIEKAAENLERNLPLRHNQSLLPEKLRRLHQSILNYYLEHGRAPTRDENNGEGWQAGVERLAGEGIIVLDQSGNITGAYPFVSEVRGYKVTTEYGAVNAMCAFDALAISSMFNLPTRIESSCRFSGQQVLIQQNGSELNVIQPHVNLYAAIDWDATDSTVSCSTSLCLEMMFIAGESNARKWRDKNPASRELFELDEAHALICAVFMPLME